MSTTALKARPVEKMWGVERLPDGFAAPDGAAPIGEIWFDPEREDADLLVKYLFTSERLSIQVHPDDAQARALGHPCGKDEAWFVIDAQPGAVIGLGLKHALTPAELRVAALNGSIEKLIDWKPVRAGDFFYSPAGTVHAIGGGVSLVEIQQNADITYRLYDYGRPRELHLDEAITVARPRPWAPIYHPREIGPGRTLLATGGCFTVERWQCRSDIRVEAGETAALLIPLAGRATVDGRPVRQASVASVRDTASLIPSGETDLLVAYPGPVRLNLRQDLPREQKRALKAAG